MDEDFKLDSHLDTICLPKFPDPRGVGNFLTGKADCSVQGWGKKAFVSNEYQEFLRQINLPIVPNPECQEKLRATRLPDNFELHDSFVCAGGSSEGGEDACEGDGGGPLVCREKLTRDNDK